MSLTSHSHRVFDPSTNPSYAFVFPRTPRILVGPNRDGTLLHPRNLATANGKLPTLDESTVVVGISAVRLTFGINGLWKPTSWGVFFGANSPYNGASSLHPCGRHNCSLALSEALCDALGSLRLIYWANPAVKRVVFVTDSASFVQDITFRMQHWVRNRERRGGTAWVAPPQFERLRAACDHMDALERRPEQPVVCQFWRVRMGENGDAHGLAMGAMKEAAWYKEVPDRYGWMDENDIALCKRMMARLLGLPS